MPSPFNMSCAGTVISKCVYLRILLYGRARRLRRVLAHHFQPGACAFIDGATYVFTYLELAAISQLPGLLKPLALPVTLRL